MRPLRVVMQAFGPYATEQVLDFADLRGAAFFLITGPTGSGKTTVLDAMSFALYGVTSGGPESEGARSGASMRSDHADPQLLTRVVFDFALGDDLYRIEREPEQERPKLRGDGTTTHNQAATLWRLRDERDELVQYGEPLATGWTKVSAETESLLGFRSEQFRQVVMLPQGRFQKLLEADSKEREQILRALFDTGYYAVIEQALKDEAASLRRTAEKVATQRDEVLRQAESASVEDLEERRAHLCVEATEADEAAADAEASREAAQARLIAGTEAAARLRELAEAGAAAESLARFADAVAEARRDCEAAVKAASVVDVAEAAAAAERQASRRDEAARGALTDHVASTKATAAAAEALARQEALAGEREAVAAEALRLRSLVGAAEALAEARVAQHDAVSAMARARAVAEEADAGWRTAQEQLEAADLAWRAAQAGLLAGTLEDGAPCPVCGSCEHPSPATLAAHVPVQADLDEARRAHNELLEVREGARRRLGQAEAVLAGVTALVKEREKGAPPESSDPAALAAAIAAAEQRSAALTEDHRTAVEAAHRADTAAVAAASVVQTTADESRRAVDDLHAARERFATRLAEAGFDDEAAWAAARRSPAETERLRALVATHDRQSIEAAERLRLAEAAAEGVTAPDLSGLEADAAQAAAAARDARSAAGGLAAAAAAAGGCLQRLAELAEQESSLGASYAVFGRLADVATGTNARHLSFQRYVLGAFLDDVLVAASQRLHVMSKSRYRLERTERRFGGKAAAGLNLEVYDAWTGVARPVATLSGGETFMAALSLALGLAEVVQAHAGGIRLETVFVDEGFGSLDEESLDLAIDSLMSLNEGGRLVGIISHVAELRERVDARLEISAGKTGSRACFVAP